MMPASGAFRSRPLPTAIAYPAIAGLPPQAGLYASIEPLVAYALLGPSRQLIVGPDAATITAMAAVLAAIPGLADAARPGIAAMLAPIVGGLYLGGRPLDGPRDPRRRAPEQAGPAPARELDPRWHRRAFNLIHTRPP